jgi:hypothetical protein
MVTPDLAHDTHSGSIRQADTFLRRLDHQLLAAPPRRNGMLLIVTSTKAEATAACMDALVAVMSPPSWSAQASRPALETRPLTTITRCSARSSGGSGYARSATPPIGEPG